MKFTTKKRLMLVLKGGQTIEFRDGEYNTDSPMLEKRLMEHPRCNIDFFPVIEKAQPKKAKKNEQGEADS
ncbi:MAG: hypothetical protein J6U43_00775 [Bacteroidales bacterium]|nr:hypothetical protein [Bacteroidales bacterium]